MVVLTSPTTEEIKSGNGSTFNGGGLVSWNVEDHNCPFEALEEVTFISPLLLLDQHYKQKI